jgi:hypothetical protein
MNEQHRYDPGRASGKASGMPMLSPQDARNRVARSEIRLVGDPDVIVEQILGLALGTALCFWFPT